MNPNLPPPLPATVAPVRKPPVWTALLAAFLSISGMFLGGGLLVGFAVGLLWTLRPGSLPSNFDGAMLALVKTPLGLLLIFLPGQLCLLCGAWGPAAISPVPFAQRLGYVRPKIRCWVALILLPATLFPTVLGGMLATLVSKEPSPSLQMFQEIARSFEGWWFVGVVAFLSLTPAIAEEALMRGYIQRRLLERWPAFWAIATSSILFTAMHFDPQHMAGVFPIAIWLGVVAWKTESLWPSMVCHAFINTFSFVMMRLSGEAMDEIGPETLLILGVSGALAAVTLFGLFRLRPVPAAARSEAGLPPGESIS